MTTIPATSWLGYWPRPEDDPEVAVQQQPVLMTGQFGATLRGILWTPPSGKWHTAIVLSHPRGDFSVHYMSPLLAAQGFAVLGFTTRYDNNDIDCLHDLAAADLATGMHWVRTHGPQHVFALGNSGGGSLTALAVANGLADIDGFIALAAHPGEGRFMLQAIDPSVTDESDPFSVDPALDMYNPANGWNPWPQPSHYDPAWLDTYRAAQKERVARIDAIATTAEHERTQARAALKNVEPGSAEWNRIRRHAVHARYLTIYRTLADPAYLDLTIDPDDRQLGSVFAAPNPLDANYGFGGLARVMTTRGWLSTWSALSSPADLITNIAKITVPTLIVHPTGDTEIRLHQAHALRDAAGADDLTYIELKNAPHYLEGHRVQAAGHITNWLRTHNW